MSAYHFKYFQNIQFKNHGIAPTPPPDLPTLKAYPTPGVGGRFGIFSLKWRERMKLKVPGAILPLGCAILSTRAKTVRGVGTTPLMRTRVKQKIPWKSHVFTIFYVNIHFCLYFTHKMTVSQFSRACSHYNVTVRSYIKGALDKDNIIPQLFPKTVGIFIPLEVLAWVMIACWVLHSRLIFFWRNVNIFSIFYCLKSTLINTEYSSLWNTLVCVTDQETFNLS